VVLPFIVVVKRITIKYFNGFALHGGDEEETGQIFW